ncbi:H-NS family nucleoid-associated regulatory protein [Burkholderia sp. PR2]|uniref:H-NS family nucleoid-associated regulatory protein n=1 Tax=Burkholderia sp. PR2 TaxID=3448078 RepID=UPI00402A918D
MTVSGSPFWSIDFSKYRRAAALSRCARSKARKYQPARARYRDPATGATWISRGRPPAWIDGKDRAQFQIAPPPALSCSLRRPNCWRLRTETSWVS